MILILQEIDSPSLSLNYIKERSKSARLIVYHLAMLYQIGKVRPGDGNGVVPSPVFYFWRKISVLSPMSPAGRPVLNVELINYKCGPGIPTVAVGEFLLTKHKPAVFKAQVK